MKINFPLINIYYEYDKPGGDKSTQVQTLINKETRSIDYSDYKLDSFFWNLFGDINKLHDEFFQLVGKFQRSDVTQTETQLSTSKSIAIVKDDDIIHNVNKFIVLSHIMGIEYDDGIQISVQLKQDPLYRDSTVRHGVMAIRRLVNRPVLMSKQNYLMYYRSVFEYTFGKVLSTYGMLIYPEAFTKK